MDHLSLQTGDLLLLGLGSRLDAVGLIYLNILVLN